MGKVAIRNKYVDYLLSAKGHISSTSLSEVLDNQFSHDQINRVLYKETVNGSTLYRQAKAMKKALSATGKKALIFDDSVQHKPYSKPNGLIAWHYDHSIKRSVKGVNFITALWTDEQCSIPLSLQIVEKELEWCNKKQKEVWKTTKTKNEILREIAGGLTKSNEVDYIITDNWYSSMENMKFITEECETHFIMAVKANRLAARSLKDAERGLYKPLEDMRLGKNAVELYFKGLDFPVLVVKKVFKNEDGSTGVLYLATSDLELTYEQIYTLYKRRWRVEEYHKSLKSNCSLGACQASSHQSQRTHFYCAALAFIRLEKVKLAEGVNHFGLMHNINILTTKYGLAVVKKHLHITLTSLKRAA